MTIDQIRNILGHFGIKLRARTFDCEILIQVFQSALTIYFITNPTKPTQQYKWQGGKKFREKNLLITSTFSML